MKARVLAFLANLKRNWNEFGEAWADPRRGLALRFVFTIMILAVASVVFVGLHLIKNTKARIAKLESHSQSALAEEVADADSAEGGDEVEDAAEGSEHATAPSGSAIFQAPIPKSIEARKDGIQEPDKDLVEPDADRGIASISGAPPKIAPYNPFFKISGIVTTTADQGTQLSRVAATISLEVDSTEAMRELEKKQGELKYMIASLISEQSSIDLKTPPGKAKLKNDVFKEVNYHLQNGKIKDVLIEEIIIQ